MSGTAQAGGGTAGDAGGTRATGTGVRGVLGLLREPGWRRGLALAVVVAVACLLLGQWQWHRRQARLAANAPLVENYDDAPVALDSVLPAGGTPLAARDAWTPVRVTGTYDASASVLARNRQHGQSVGYDVLVPLVLDDGTALLVDRGWVPAGSSSRAPDTVPAPPGGEVTVTAHVRPWEPARDSTVPEGQVASIAAGPVARAADAAGAPPLRDAYAVLAEEEPAPAQAPAAPERPEVDEGPHLAYTVQWYGFALTALVVWVIAGRRELQARSAPVDVPAPVGGGVPDGGVPDGAAPAGGSRSGAGSPGDGLSAAAAAPRPAALRRHPARGARRVRPGSDEEAEDLAIARAGDEAARPPR
ncbi:SURF1 family protein [Paenibacillus sp. TRM 82003]|uniref:SURF1 family cytochrome oxidase biogenesis protein n=1 Tax=Kineococcus sp. TRM81007 TaxID=2925831 RepID=UPI001F570A80|nr:SURF1 family protein [Kineococcus sp. TRM81007]MCI2237651.1 SURF1 family protein [Kineococcus sp. TRM81007]MCI3921668.1 SURF1 family protein [Paenibacillus sp. TRM 82003]